MEKLEQHLRETPLDPTFEDYGNFIKANPVNMRGNLIYPDGYVEFWGNFYLVSDCFRFATNNAEQIEKWTGLIRKNQQRDDYLIRACEYQENKIKIREIDNNPHISGIEWRRLRAEIGRP